VNKWWVIARREWQVSFQSPLAYVLLGLWMLLAGWFYVSIILSSQSTDLGPLGQNMTILLLFIAPLLTMRLLAEERRSGSEELMLTAPLSPAQWVVGKYIGALLVWTIFIAVAFLFPLVTSRLGALAWGPVAALWLGLWLFGAATLAIGLFASALTENQVVAAMVSFAVVLLFYATTWIQTTGWVSTLLGYLSMPNQLNDFTVGILSVRHLLYFISLICGFLFISVRAVDMRRWT